MKKFGTLEEDQEQRVRQLSTDQLDALGEALLAFQSAEDLRHWLDTNTSE